MKVNPELLGLLTLTTGCSTGLGVGVDGWTGGGEGTKFAEFDVAGLKVNPEAFISLETATGLSFEFCSSVGLKVNPELLILLDSAFGVSSFTAGELNVKPALEMPEPPTKEKPPAPMDPVISLTSLLSEVGFDDDAVAASGLGASQAAHFTSSLVFATQQIGHLQESVERANWSPQPSVDDEGLASVPPECSSSEPPSSESSSSPNNQSTYQLQKSSFEICPSSLSFFLYLLWSSSHQVVPNASNTFSKASSGILLPAPSLSSATLLKA
mmetsp:Transcript_15581/g.19524  ORF Transcript_15581/g.19524 Transcript_15581/m.19524 type:complete len:269 (-) Transcript_15581:43-849(-)